ncbi:MAG: hypothetical protein WD845_15705 [Pirellulales bacterium]
MRTLSIIAALLLLVSSAIAQQRGETNRARDVEFKGVAQRQFDRSRSDDWRYKYHSGRWWFWQPNNSWVIWDGYAWSPYRPGEYRTGYRGGYYRYPGSYDRGYRRGDYYGPGYYRPGYGPGYYNRGAYGPGYGGYYSPEAAAGAEIGGAIGGPRGAGIGGAIGGAIGDR